MTELTIVTGYLSGEPVVIDARQIISVWKPTTGGKTH